MPSRHIIKQYTDQGFYHLYNRGVEKRTIFQDDQDYKVFLGYLKQYLSPKPDPTTLSKALTFKGETFKGIPRQPKNYHSQISLICFVLMPNHFHLLVQQGSTHTIKEFMQSLSTRYTSYFNKRHKRIGPLFQSAYKGILISDDAYLLHLTRYIHLNPQSNLSNLADTYSSYADYLGLRHTPWVKPQFVLNYFNRQSLPINHQYSSYQQFVESSREDSQAYLGDFTIEQDDDLTT